MRWPQFEAAGNGEGWAPMDAGGTEERDAALRADLSTMPEHVAQVFVKLFDGPVSFANGEDGDPVWIRVKRDD